LLKTTKRFNGFGIYGPDDFEELQTPRVAKFEELQSLPVANSYFAYFTY